MPDTSSMSLGLWDYVAFGSFFVVLSIIGYMAGRKERGSSQEYFLAGRKLPWYVVGCSFIASNISSEHFIGMIGASFIYGICICMFSWDMKNAHGEQGRVYGQKPHNNKISGARPALPPGVGGGGHGGSHGHLTSNFIESILLDRKPIVNVSEALNMTLAGVMAHKSALKDGEWMKVPQYKL